MSPVRDAPAFDFYPERWLVGVAGMSDAEQLAYLRLLCHQWLLQGLPEDVPALRRLGGSKGVTPAVLAKLPLQADGKRRNARLETIRTEQRERIAKSREKIAKMNTARAAARGALAKGGPAPKADQHAGTQQDDLRKDLQDALQGGPEAGLGGDLPAELGGALQDRLEARRREPPGEALGERLDAFLTPHHPPPTSVPAAIHPPAGVRVRPTLEQACAIAPEIGLTPAQAETWWLAREASEWLRSSNGALMPVGDNWRADAKTFTQNALQRRHPQGNPRAAPPRSDTANAPGRYA